MAAFILLLFFCLVCGAGGYVLRRVDWRAVDEENARYYNADGYHIYYDRKILRRLYGGEAAANETNE